MLKSEEKTTVWTVSVENGQCSNLESKQSRNFDRSGETQKVYEQRLHTYTHILDWKPLLNWLCCPVQVQQNPPTWWLTQKLHVLPTHVWCDQLCKLGAGKFPSSWQADSPEITNVGCFTQPRPTHLPDITLSKPILLNLCKPLALTHSHV